MSGLKDVGLKDVSLKDVVVPCLIYQRFSQTLGILWLFLQQLGCNYLQRLWVKQEVFAAWLNTLYLCQND